MVLMCDGYSKEPVAAHLLHLGSTDVNRGVFIHCVLNI